MIRKHDLIIIGTSLVMNILMIFIYSQTFGKSKEIASVDVSTIVNEFTRLMTKSKFDEQKTTQMLDIFSSTFEEGLISLSQDKIILSKKAVVSNEEDLTDDLRSLIAARLIQGDKE